MQNKIKIILLLLLVSFTFFFNKCNEDIRFFPSRGSYKPVVEKKFHFSFSSGFPVPLFDLKRYYINSRKAHIWEIEYSYKAIFALIINGLIIYLLYKIIYRGISAERINRKYLIAALLINIILFNLSLLLKFFPELLKIFLTFAFELPAFYIQYPFELLLPDKDNLIVGSRVYFVLSAILYYFIFKLFYLIKKSLRRVKE